MTPPPGSAGSRPPAPVPTGWRPMSMPRSFARFCSRLNRGIARARPRSESIYFTRGCLRDDLGSFGRDRRVPVLGEQQREAHPGRHAAAPVAERHIDIHPLLAGGPGDRARGAVRPAPVGRVIGVAPGQDLFDGQRRPASFRGRVVRPAEHRPQRRSRPAGRGVRGAAPGRSSSSPRRCGADRACAARGPAPGGLPVHLGPHPDLGHGQPPPLLGPALGQQPGQRRAAGQTAEALPQGHVDVLPIFARRFRHPTRPAARPLAVGRMVRVGPGQDLDQRQSGEGPSDYGRRGARPAAAPAMSRPSGRAGRRAAKG